MERDFFKEPLSEAELRSLAEGGKMPDIFSWKSPSFKALGLNADDLDEDRMVELVLKEPRLLRRPLVRIGSHLLVGSNLKELERAVRELQLDHEG